jgi:hypothetical protein
MGRKKSFFSKPKKEKAEFRDAPDDVKLMAAQLITEQHGGLAEAKICYLVRTGEWKKKGNDVFGTAELVSKKHKHLTGYDFIITIGYRAWTMAPDEGFKKALMDHELTHCCKDVDKEGNPKYYIQDHSVNDFASIIRRHGLWDQSLRIMMNAFQEHEQVSMFDKKKTGTEG